MLVSGRNGVLESLRAGKTFNKILVAKGSNHKEIVDIAKQNGIRLEFLDRTILDKKIKNNQGVIGEIVDFCYSSLDEVVKNANGMIVILDGIEDPHNFGAIIRTCECAGVKGIIIPKHRAVPVNDTVVKASAGAIANVKIAMVTNINSAIDSLKDEGYWVYACEAGGKEMYKESFCGKIALVIGSEGFGVSKLTKQKCDTMISIPLLGSINSLNASVACSIVLYECVRQKIQAGEYEKQN